MMVGAVWGWSWTVEIVEGVDGCVGRGGVGRGESMEDRTWLVVGGWKRDQFDGLSD